MVFIKRTLYQQAKRVFRSTVQLNMLGVIECLIQKIRGLYYLYSERSVDQKKVQVGKDQEKAQSEKDSHSKTFRRRIMSGLEGQTGFSSLS